VSFPESHGVNLFLESLFCRPFAFSNLNLARLVCRQKFDHLYSLPFGFSLQFNSDW
jgi:hypothetical protein